MAYYRQPSTSSPADTGQRTNQLALPISPISEPENDFLRQYEIPQVTRQSDDQSALQSALYYQTHLKNYNLFPPTELRSSYNQATRNVFLQMQKISLSEPKKPKVATASTRATQANSSPNNLQLSQRDSFWFEYYYNFALTWDTIPNPRFIPGFLFQMYTMSLSHPVLRKSILATASGYAAIVQHKSFDTTRQYLAQVIPEIQLAITMLGFDEGHLCAVFQLVQIHVELSDIAGAHKHLCGLSAMIEQLIAKRKEPHPIVMCVLRGAMQFDIDFAVEGYGMAFSSPMGKQEKFHRKWLTEFTPYSKRHVIDFALAQIELQDLEHQTMGLLQLRQSPTYNPDIDEQVISEAGRSILRDLSEWRKQVFIELCEVEEREARKSEAPSCTGGFLHYPPLTFRNYKYSRLLLSYHSIVILATFLDSPRIGPLPSIRRESAVTLCRIMAFTEQASKKGLKGPCLWHVHDMLRAGLVLGETTHPLEFGWIIEKLREKKFTLMDRLADELVKTWRTGRHTYGLYGRGKAWNGGVVMLSPDEPITINDEYIF